MPAPRPLIRIALFRNDLRVHDQLLLHAAAASSPSHVLPLYCVDPRQFDCAPLGLGFAPATTWHFGLPRAAPFKTRFLVEAVQALQRELRTRKSDLLVRFGEPEAVVKGLVEHLAREEGADVEVLCQREVCSRVGVRSGRR
jgi:deoxyribodipyrimidine photo-lyase